MATTFVSPGIYTREQDFSVFASRVGLTKLGLVGLTEKGPAFEATKVRSTDEFLFRFGGQNTNMQLPYVANAFLTQSNELTVTRILGKEGYTNSPAWIIKGEGPGDKDGTILAVLRSKSLDEGASPIFSHNIETDIEIGNVTPGAPLDTFTLSASTGPLTAYTLNVTLDESKTDYIVNILGKNAKSLSSDFGIYVESIYPHFLREAAQRGEITGLTTSLVYIDDSAYTDYKGEYTNPETPYIVSNVVGNEVRNLFKFQSISDGNSANEEIKISISNIDTVNKTFDVIIRDFYDNDATAFQTALERFRGVSLDPNQRNYIARVIGTTDEEYPRNSLFVTVDIVEGHPTDVVPGGFRGYQQRELGVSGETAPTFYYKTEYFSGDSINRTFLGISELGYTGFTTNQVTVSNAINSVEQDMFDYIGGTSTGTTTIPGFHLESSAPSNNFVTGAYNGLSGYTKSERKFTLAPAGGFDGWNKFRRPEFTPNAIDTANRASFKLGIDEFTNPEEVDINLFATPGINFNESEEIVKYALDKIEDRADSLYIIDSPRVTSNQAKGTAEEVTLNLQDTGIDSNYAATYWPWVQIEDTTSGRFVYIPPTAEVVKAIALTDNVSFPWFAPAGINRGTTSDIVRRADIKLSQADRDELYDGRINPVATFTQQGVVIYGQKTLQVRQSALDRINVRRLLLQIRRLVAATSQTLLFEQNDQTLRDQFLSKVEPLLLQIQNQRGLTGFRVIMDESNNPPEVVDRNTLVGKIQLKPTRTAEFIDLTFQVLPTGARFEDF